MSGLTDLRCEAIAAMWRLERGWSESRDASLPRFGPSDGGKSLRPALSCIDEGDLDYKGTVLLPLISRASNLSISNDLNLSLLGRLTPPYKG